MIEAVIFDMDGLLVDSEPLWQRARIEACGAERLQWTEADQEQVMGSSTEAWASYLAAKLDHEYTTVEIIERVVSQMEAYYRESVPLLPGAHAIIDRVSRHYPLGLASGASYRLINAVLDNAGWRDRFVEVLSADDMAQGKPAPDIYLAITQRMGVPIGNAVIFEDSTNGILAGCAAGGKVIAVPGAYHTPAAETLAKADLVLDSLADFDLAVLADL
jgi:HAD superfamily hydrolase (TIGR01509 family)